MLADHKLNKSRFREPNGIIMRFRVGLLFLVITAVALATSYSIVKLYSLCFIENGVVNASDCDKARRLKRELPLCEDNSELDCCYRYVCKNTWG